MELYTLNSSFQPENLIENYESLLWTERYSKAGDFELVSSDVYATQNALPKESYVTLRESTVPMLVEYHKIEKKKNVAPKLTVIGRTYEACALERRASVNSLAAGVIRAAWLISAAKESDAAYEAMRVVLGDVARSQLGFQVLPSVSPAISANDAIPEIDLILPADYKAVIWSATATYIQNDVVYYSSNFYIASALSSNLNKIPSSQPTFWSVLSSPGVITGGTSKSYEIASGKLYDTVMELINTNNHGIKSVRPGENDTKIGIEIYNGADLTADVVFDARFDQFDDATYLHSYQGSTNVAYVYGNNGSQKVLKTTAPEPSGMDRRVLLVDQSSDETANTIDIRTTRGLIELYKNNVTAMFDGEIALQIASGYNTSYFLGDIVKMVGEYGHNHNSRVVEFIRSSDASGEKAYPTFEAIVE